MSLGLELGADDYVVKPFSPRELAARVRTVLRRVNAPTPRDGRRRRRVRSAAHRPDAARWSSMADGVDADSEGVRSPVHALPAHPRQVFSRRQLLAQVWDSAPEYQDSATVTVHVGRLRQKLEADPRNPRWITTAWGVGYRFEP